MNATLYTIGFTQKGAERFFGMLRAAGVRTLLDIRARPDSQLAGFARARDLQWLLGALCGITYRHVPALAPSAELLSDYRAGKVGWPDYEARYLDTLDGDAVFAQLSGAELDRACLLCAEPTPEQCHRRLAGEWLVARTPGVALIHLV